MKEGKATRDSQVKVFRGGKVIAESKLIGLRRFKDDVKEVTNGMDFGVKLESFGDFQVGDILQFVRQELID
jgi:translation initiation factor IF-2